jgi:hypothetical protein
MLDLDLPGHWLLVARIFGFLGFLIDGLSHALGRLLNRRAIPSMMVSRVMVITSMVVIITTIRKDYRTSLGRKNQCQSYHPYFYRSKVHNIISLQTQFGHLLDKKTP